MDDLTTRVVVLLAVLAGTAVLGAWWRARQGVVRSVDGGHRLTAAELGAPLGAHGTLVQFSSAVCAPCRATARLLTDLVADRPGLAHVELDAEQHLPLVRRLDVLRTPTTVVLDDRGVPVHRISGVPERPALVAVLDRLAGLEPGPLDPTARSPR